MYDQSFNKQTLTAVIRKREHYLLSLPTTTNDIETVINLAIDSVKAKLKSKPQQNPLICFNLSNRQVFKLINFHDELIVRKIANNIKNSTYKNYTVLKANRSHIISCLKLLLEEEVSCRVYVIDIKEFYESFQKEEIRSKLMDITYLSPQSKEIITNILDFHNLIGGRGVPRGLSISALLSELLMEHFDNLITKNENTYYYSRYVDDIIILTSKNEDKNFFLNNTIKNNLPMGLNINQEKTSIIEVNSLKKSNFTSKPISYLGYTLEVKDNGKIRTVSIKISENKIKKIKRRIIRAFLDYIRTGDQDLLLDRLTYLTQNFSVYNPKINNRIMTGIYYNYPLVTDIESIKDLDFFLKMTASTHNKSKTRLGVKFSKSLIGQTVQKTFLLKPELKRKIMHKNFYAGYTKKIYTHFSSSRLSKIQQCWKY